MPAVVLSLEAAGAGAAGETSGEVSGEVSGETLEELRLRKADPDFPEFPARPAGFIDIPAGNPVRRNGASRAGFRPLWRAGCFTVGFTLAIAFLLGRERFFIKQFICFLFFSARLRIF
jgi:hypothetical protein